MPRRYRAWKGLVVAGGLAAGLTGCGSDPSEERAPAAERSADEVEALDPAVIANLPSGVTPELVEQGRRLFITCAPCHGPGARGTELGPSLRDGEWIHISGTLPEIESVTREGVAEPAEFEIPMPVMGGGRFTAEQLRAVSAYVFAISRDRSQPPAGES